VLEPMCNWASLLGVCPVSARGRQEGVLSAPDKTCSAFRFPGICRHRSLPGPDCTQDCGFSTRGRACSFYPSGPMLDIPLVVPYAPQQLARRAAGGFTGPSSRGRPQPSYGDVPASTGTREVMVACPGASTAGSKTDEETTVANSNDYGFAAVA